MRNIEAIFFDLDGTLVNSLADLAEAGNAVLAEVGYPPHPLDAYRMFVGSGPEVLLRRALPAGEADRLGARLKILCQRFGEIYNTRWNRESRPYDGMPEALAALNRRGMPIAVVTNKPQDWAEPFVRYFYPDVAFAEVRGLRPGVPKKPAPDGVLAVAANMGVATKDCLFLGDTNVDMKTAVNSGCFPVGVTWGFRDRRELVEAGAKALLDDPGDIIPLMDRFLSES